MPETINPVTVQPGQTVPAGTFPTLALREGEGVRLGHFYGVVNRDHIQLSYKRTATTALDITVHDDDLVEITSSDGGKRVRGYVRYITRRPVRVAPRRNKAA